jgi:hypothetical protein
MEAICSSETSGCLQTTLCWNPEDDTIHYNVTFMARIGTEHGHWYVRIKLLRRKNKIERNIITDQLHGAGSLER